MRKVMLCAGVLAGTAFLAFSQIAAAGGTSHRYVVVFERGVSAHQAGKAIHAAGGRILSVNHDVGVALVASSDTRFMTKADRQKALFGAARERTVGHVPGAGRKPAWRAVETGDATPARLAHHDQPQPVDGDQLSGLQWDMKLIGATPAGSYSRQQGSHAVRVGILDTGVDGSHPDIAPNFDRALSRNFTQDNSNPGVDDGPCEHPDLNCVDPVDEDDDGHGTHVSGTIGAALNGIGVAGVAPKVDIVNIRAGQDSGFFFLKPTVDALTYAGDNGIDVVNMSYYIDPWLYNCTSNPADSPSEQQEQRTIIQATHLAVAYARSHGVTLVSAEGNESTDLGHPGVDDTSPDFPPDAAKERTIDNSTCLNEPAEAPGVITVSAVGPPNHGVARKSFYSNYGVEQTDVSAPGGDSREFFGTPQYLAAQNRVLSAYPLNVAQACQEVDANGVPRTDGTSICVAGHEGVAWPRPTPVVRDCAEGVCALYQWAQGTSMASPHAVGVAALIVAEFGRRDRHNPGLTLDPRITERILKRTATDTPCPAQEPFVYPDDSAPPALCEGSPAFNGFYGEGIVNAVRAVRAGD